MKRTSRRVRRIAFRPPKNIGTREKKEKNGEENGALAEFWLKVGYEEKEQDGRGGSSCDLI